MSVGMSPEYQLVFMCLFEELQIVHCGKEGKGMVAAVDWPLLWAVWLATDAQLKPEDPVRKLEEWKLGKDIWLSTTMLALELADNVREQDTKLESLAWNFAKLGGYKLSKIKLGAQVTKLDFDEKRWNAWEN